LAGLCPANQAGLHALNQQGGLNRHKPVRYRVQVCKLKLLKINR